MLKVSFFYLEDLLLLLLQNIFSNRLKLTIFSIIIESKLTF